MGFHVHAENGINSGLIAGADEPIFTVIDAIINVYDHWSIKNLNNIIKYDCHFSLAFSRRMVSFRLAFCIEL